MVKIAIMLDINKDTAKAYAAQNLNDFIVISDGRFWNSPIVRLYHVTKLPGEILISPQGKIMAVGEQVRKKL